MKILFKFALVSGMAMLLSACGGDSKSTGPCITAETGSSNLLVDADISGSDIGSGLFKTDFLVTVMDGSSAAINTATVTITHNVLGATNLVWDTLIPGTYKATVTGYVSGGYTLDVTSGNDFISNGRVIAPDRHSITFPTVTDTIPLNTIFTTLWSRTTVAEVVEIETRDFGPALASSVGDTDDGSYDIPASQTARDDQRIRITRSNSATLTKGLSGSIFKAGIRNAVEPLVVI